MMILLLCNGLSALVGLGQVFRPGTFNPPVIRVSPPSKAATSRSRRSR